MNKLLIALLLALSFNASAEEYVSCSTLNKQNIRNCTERSLHNLESRAGSIIMSVNPKDSEYKKITQMSMLTFYDKAIESRKIAINKFDSKQWSANSLLSYMHDLSSFEIDRLDSMSKSSNEYFNSMERTLNTPDPQPKNMTCKPTHDGQVDCYSY